MQFSATKHSGKKLRKKERNCNMAKFLFWINTAVIFPIFIVGKICESIMYACERVCDKLDFRLKLNK